MPSRQINACLQKSKLKKGLVVTRPAVSAEDWLKTSLPDYEDHISCPRGQDPRQVVNMKPAGVVSDITAEEAVKKATALANEYAQLNFK